MTRLPSRPDARDDGTRQLPSTMTRDLLGDVSLSTPDAFRAVLTEAVVRAFAAGVPIDGIWEIQTGDHRPNWEVEIVELAHDEEEPTDP